MENMYRKTGLNEFGVWTTADPEIPTLVCPIKNVFVFDIFATNINKEDMSDQIPPLRAGSIETASRRPKSEIKPQGTAGDICVYAGSPEIDTYYRFLTTAARQCIPFKGLNALGRSRM